MSETRIVRIISAVFDLKDSTSMVSRPESLEYVSQYLQRFLRWLAERIKKLVRSPRVSSMTQQGDGAVVVWEYMLGDQEKAVSTVIRACLEIIREFRGEFSKTLMEEIPLYPLPGILRCGIAEGGAASVALSKKSPSPAGYFGFCIALATRLQKACEGISFAISGRISLRPELVDSLGLVRKASYFRGVGPEVLYVLKREYDQLPVKSHRVVASLGGRLTPDPSDGLLTHDDALEFADAINMRNTKDPVFLIVAAQKLKMLKERYPNVTPVLVEQAKIFRIGEKRERLEQAIELLTQAIKIDPTYKRAFFNRACYYCLIASQLDGEERERLLQSCCEDLSQVVLDEPTWRHWMQEDPDLQLLREHELWKKYFARLPPPMPPLPM
jgi:class 3 adenylate cyclase